MADMEAMKAMEAMKSMKAMKPMKSKRVSIFAKGEEGKRYCVPRGHKEDHRGPAAD